MVSDTMCINFIDLQMKKYQVLNHSNRILLIPAGHFPPIVYCSHNGAGYSSDQDRDLSNKGQNLKLPTGLEMDKTGFI